MIQLDKGVGEGVTLGAAEGENMTVGVGFAESRSAETPRTDGPIAGCNNRTAANTRTAANATPARPMKVLRIKCRTAWAGESSGLSTGQCFGSRSRLWRSMSRIALILVGGSSVINRMETWAWTGSDWNLLLSASYT